MVDYSKWDKFNYNDSDEEEETSYGKKNVQVTTIPDKKGGKVTIGPQGYHIHGDEDESEEENPPSFREIHQTILENERKKVNISSEEEEEPDDLAEVEGSAAYQEKIQHYLKQQHMKESHTASAFQPTSHIPTVASGTSHNAGGTTTEKPIQFGKSSSHKIEPSLRTKNGARGTYQNVSYEWSQTRYEATVYLYLTEETLREKLKDNPFPDYPQLKKRDFHLTYEEVKDYQFVLALFYRHRPTIGSESLIPLLQGVMQYEVETTGDRDNPYDDIVEWEVDHSDPTHLQLSSQQVTIEIVLKKHRKFTNAIIWWKNIFRGEPEIDLTKIAERSNNYAEFMHNFQLANQQFLEKIKDNEKIEI